jgi:hypothetical protein
MYRDFAVCRSYTVAATGTTILSLACPLTPKDLLSYMELYNIELAVWERRVLFEIDAVVLPILNRPRGKDDKKGKSIPVTDTAAIKANYQVVARRTR